MNLRDYPDGTKVLSVCFDPQEGVVCCYAALLPNDSNLAQHYPSVIGSDADTKRPAVHYISGKPDTGLLDGSDTLIIPLSETQWTALSQAGFPTDFEAALRIAQSPCDPVEICMARLKDTLVTATRSGDPDRALREIQGILTEHQATIDTKASEVAA